MSKDELISGRDKITMDEVFRRIYEDEETENDIPKDGFIIDSNVLIKYCGEGGDVVIPDGVISIGKDAFNGSDKLNTITIPSSVTSIGEFAFYGCGELTSVTMLSGVISIGEFAFSNCSKLTSVAVPQSVTYIGESAFFFCNDLTSAMIPSSVTTIGGNAFYFCSKLNSIDYNGTVSQWNAIEKGEDWDLGTDDYVVHCTDGEIS